MDLISLLMKVIRLLFDPSFLFILGGGWVLIKLFRSGYVNHLGVLGRHAVFFFGAFLFGWATAYCHLFSPDYGAWVVGGIGGVAGIIVKPWLWQPARNQGEDDRLAQGQYLPSAEHGAESRLTAVHSMNGFDHNDNSEMQPQHDRRSM